MLGFIFRPLRHSLTTLSSVAYDLVHFLILVARSRRLLAAENLYTCENSSSCFKNGG